MIRRYELARKMGVAPTTISSWKTRHADFPQPIGRFYDLEAVIKWKAEHDAKESDSGKGISQSTA